MKIEDVEVGMRVKASEILDCVGKGYVRPDDTGVVVCKGGNKHDCNVFVRWDNPLIEQCNNIWVIHCRNIEPVEV